MKLDSLTGLRAILALLVVVCHGGQRVGWLEKQDIVSGVLVGFGHFGVVCFFVLSGFILNVVYFNRDWTIREYAVNRFARIYPLYLLCLIFTFPIDWFSPGFESGNRIESLLLTLLMQQSWFDFSNGRFNGPGWTLGVEFFFYAAFPILVAIQRRSSILLLLLFFFSMTASMVFWDPSDFYCAHRFPLMRIWEFILGMVLGQVFLTCKVMIKVKHRVSLAMLVLLAGPTLGHFFPVLSGWAFSEWLLMSLCAGTVIVLLGDRDREPGARSMMAGKKWVLGGEISFGVYLLHDGVQRYSKVVLEKGLNVKIESVDFLMKGAYIGTTLVASVVLAWVLYKVVEVPGRKYFRERLGK